MIYQDLQALLVQSHTEKGVLPHESRLHVADGVALHCLWRSRISKVGPLNLFTVFQMS
jgi:hypothetical protein